ncbi:glutathione S-transferase [Gilbertella persicaria]|uniref:glutathione S-transferase n=1 Tax=Gilbertella persicaria TaxID=101096 RepID=UPI00221E487D|nr:glutathione S-transferase [Gilbertella persicaria]KAI8091460.1 glutathione S-transferase [Gilbertella persicaria]
MSGLSNLKLYYFTQVKGKTTLGRGEYVRLLLEDAGVDFEYDRCTFEEWGIQKEKLIAQGIHKPTLPYITIDGKDEDEAQLVDAYADTVTDDITRWAAANFRGIEQLTQKYNEVDRPQAFETYERILGSKPGPYLLGEEVSYADFFLYHYLEDDASAFEASDFKSTHPHLAAFIEAIQNRPNLKKYLATDRK